ncbi:MULTISPECIES: cyclase family protein [unclassified Arcicella]|uniref:cyclase family protein n=1 Tax=unclassified Arcicella TaxID=2644986 RepID=UPI0028631366|nr:MULTISPECIES: cyclase family protein [unclassified Arcicella]MDR6564181.1 kynurenine formamidase [Arcicella sp. BE51]MDR6811573.1 kynurenine formamidase [Arcicella sp. BE140]MDR6823099.1 kynurenine formamidase [Arcicella sp. BE139]
MKFIDLSHVIEEGVVTYKGMPAPVICDFWTREESKSWYEEGTSFQIGKIEMVANTGTYLDTPFHRYEDGKDLSQILIEQTALLDAVLISVPYYKQLSIDKSFFEGLDLTGKAVLVHTRWDEKWKTDEYYSGNPFLTADAAEYLVSQRVKLVGIDSHNIDDVSGKARPVHSILLKNEILIVEHLCNLGEIPTDTSFKFSATPPKVKGMGTFPVRAYAVIETL